MDYHTCRLTGIYLILIFITQFNDVGGWMRICSQEQYSESQSKGTITYASYDQWEHLHHCECNLTSNIDLVLELDIQVETDPTESLPHCHPRLVADYLSTLRICPTGGSTHRKHYALLAGRQLNLRSHNTISASWRFIVNFTTIPRTPVEVSCGAVRVGPIFAPPSDYDSVIAGLSPAKQGAEIGAYVAIVLILLFLGIIFIAAYIKVRKMEKTESSPWRLKWLPILAIIKIDTIRKWKRRARSSTTKLDASKSDINSTVGDNPAFDATPKSSINDITLLEGKPSKKALLKPHINGRDFPLNNGKIPRSTDDYIPEKVPNYPYKNDQPYKNDITGAPDMGPYKPRVTFMRTPELEHTQPLKRAPLTSMPPGVYSQRQPHGLRDRNLPPVDHLKKPGANNRQPILDPLFLEKPEMAPTLGSKPQGPGSRSPNLPNEGEPVYPVPPSGRNPNSRVPPGVKTPHYPYHPEEDMIQAPQHVPQNYNAPPQPSYHPQRPSPLPKHPSPFPQHPSPLPHHPSPTPQRQLSPIPHRLHNPHNKPRLSHYIPSDPIPPYGLPGPPFNVSADDIRYIDEDSQSVISFGTSVEPLVPPSEISSMYSGVAYNRFMNSQATSAYTSQATSRTSLNQSAHETDV